MSEVNVIYVCADCKNGFDRDETVNIERAVAGHAWRAIQRVCRKCAEENKDTILDFGGIK